MKKPTIKITLIVKLEDCTTEEKLRALSDGNG